MRIVTAHNYYREHGGEDRVYEDESELLESRGNEVTRFTRRNSDFSGLDTIKVAAGTAWNRGAASELETLVKATNAEVVHFHNWLPQISLGAFYAARRAGAAVVQTLHNYRYTCANATFYRDDAVCEDCLTRTVGWPAVVHGCYRNSRPGSFVVAASLAAHRAIGTYDRVVDAIIAPSQFTRSKLAAAGLSQDRSFVKPNFLDPDPGPGEGDGAYAVYAGRLSSEKGILNLLDGWRQLRSPIELRIAGAGPLQDEVQRAADDLPGVEYVGFLRIEDVLAMVGNARFSVLPSLTYEVSPKTVVESFARGTPVIGSRRGAVAELIEDQKTGYLFEPDDTADIADVVQTAFADTDGYAAMRLAAREEFVGEYGADQSYDRLMEIYRFAIEHRATS